MDVWVVWPTVNADRSKAMVDKWHGNGYKVAVLVNPGTDGDAISADKVIVQEKWKGFATAANLLCRSVPSDVVVVVGDDMYPDPRFTAQEIARDFLVRFPNTYGVMQPIGDDFAMTKECAVSPWIGRAFIDEAYAGTGPFFEGYYHYFTDHELQIVAEGMGVFQQRSDLSQFHDHWQRNGADRPEYLQEAKRRWAIDQCIFKCRSSQGFPGSNRVVPIIPAQAKAWTKQYSNGPPHGHETSNGYGSFVENTEEIRAALPGIFREYGIKVFTDIPCGDWNWMRLLYCSGGLRYVNYLGIDVVAEQIADNVRRFGGFAHIAFDVGNAVSDPIRKSDMILCRDLLFHLPNELALKALYNIKASGSKWLLSTTFPGMPNKDLFVTSNVGWRAIDLQAFPFNLPEPVLSIQENDSHACQGRLVSMFDLEDWQCQ